MRSYYDLGEGWEIDGAVYVVQKLGEGYERAEHIRTDLRLGWRPREDLNLYIGVQSLENPTHSELDEFDNVRRSVFVGIDWTPGFLAPGAGNDYEPYH